MNISVKNIRYSLISCDGIIYESCSPKAYDTENFELVLENNILTCTPKNQCTSKEAAREEIERMLKSWEVHESLKNGGTPQFRFEYKDSDIENLDDNPGSITVFAECALTGAACLTCTVTTIVTRRSYPDIPTDFRINADVDVLIFRYRQYLEGHEPLPSMGYFCYSYVEYLGYISLTDIERNKIRPIKKASDILNIEDKVLKVLSRLTSTKGDERYARKGYGNFESLTSIEVYWIEKCILLIIQRLGECQNSSSLKLITLSDLPKI